MKRSWITWPIVGGVIVLLTIFLALQYRWQVQASSAEREIMQKRVEADTRQFAEDFNREIQAAYFNFQMDAEAWNRSDWAQFNERYDYWRSKTQYPELIRDFYYLKVDPDAALHFNNKSRAFEEQALPADIAELKSQVFEDKTLRPIYPKQFALVLPIHPVLHKFERIRVLPGMPGMKEVTTDREVPKTEGYLIVLLDRDVIENIVLPELVAKHFPDGDYRVDIKDKDQAAVFQTNGDVEKADATERLMTLSPDNMIFFANKDMLPRSAERHANMVISQRVESHSFGRVQSESNSKTFTFELNADEPGKKTEVLTGTMGDGDGWALGVQHKSGSVESFVSGEQNRKLLTGLSIYLLVIGAIIAITMSAMRSQRFAQRQIDFVSSVSHEFRTPLAVIYSAGENLADGVAKNESQVERYGSLIKSEGRKLSGMVEQILEFAGARSGRRKYMFNETNVNDVIERALSQNAEVLDNQGFVLETDLSDRLPTINADAEALSSAVQNLIQNAIKYSNGDRRITIGTFLQNGDVAIEVADHGIGVSAAELKKIFEPFYRTKDVVDAQIHGNGLGLALVKEVVDAHGGSVTAESEKGKGSKFTIELPRGDSDP
jgi:signal transduction histidine kinase